MITYEYPLNERIRTLLRLEDLFERSRHFIARSDPHDHHMALLTLFEILEVSSRADLKSDLLQELERQKQVLLAFKNNPDIAEDALNGVLRDIEQAAAALFSMTGKIGQYLRSNDWLMSIKQRTGIPGGACEFDLPSYHYWLHRPAEERTGQLAAWTGPLYPLRDGTAIILRILRESGRPQSLTAPQGMYQQMQGGKSAQMLRLRIDQTTPCVPEISANKYVLNIRFMAQNGESTGDEARPRTADWNVGFELTFCNL
ncbi:MAG: cell division protein ZapD [Betaproteobacteria bacterium]|nr:cell division protein ZapD [Betaproteobacteria bacterium]